MKKRVLIGLPVLLLMIALASCKDYEEKWVDKMVGHWTVARYQVTEIDTVGNTTSITDAKNAGYYDFRVSVVNGLTLEGYFDFIKHIEIDGRIISTEGGGTVGEDGGRLIMYGGACIQCDTTYTIDVDTKNQKVISRYYPESGSTLTRKIQITLER